MITQLGRREERVGATDRDSVRAGAPTAASPQGGSAGIA